MAPSLGYKSQNNILTFVLPIGAELAPSAGLIAGSSLGAELQAQLDELMGLSLRPAVLIHGAELMPSLIST